MGTHSNILAWRIPRTEEPGGLQPIAWQSQATEHSHTTYITQDLKYHMFIMIQLKIFLKYVYFMFNSWAI